MKRTLFALIITLFYATFATAQSKVYFTKTITPQSLVEIYKALGVKATGRVAVKISTGEAGGHNYLKPDLICNLVDEVSGTIVECNTAYGGKRMKNEDHWATIHDHGFDSIAAVDIMDEYDEIRIPVQDKTHLKYNIVGGHLANYDFMINLAHFKGHAMGGFGGVLKNASIGVASSAGKAYIHTAGYTTNLSEMWKHVDNQDGFLESMAAAAQAVHNYFGGRVLYINVLNNISIDCDCDSHPHDPELKDIGIMASTDPVALDKACLDIIYGIKPEPGNDNRSLIKRIEAKHGGHTIDWAEKIGLGTKNYKLVSLDKK